MSLILLLLTLQINRAIVRAEGGEDTDRAIYELEACVPVESQVDCFRSAITVYAIPDPIGMNNEKAIYVHISALGHSRT
jgi:hypothetical protein